MRVYTLLILSFITFSSLFSQLIINEVLSSNVNGITDDDLEYSDWFELYNPSDTSININGFSITDELALPGKWVFPEVNITPQGHLLVFASGKNKIDLPVNYQTIIDMDSEWQYILPDSEMGASWQLPGFDASSWQTGRSGFGYGDGDDSTLVDPTLSIFIRKEFSISKVEDISQIALHVDYDDGFVAYINGHEVARANLGVIGQNIPYNFATGASIHEATMYLGGVPDYFTIQNPQEFLVEGVNVIAIQVHNSDIGSSDLTIIPILSLGQSVGAVSNSISPWINLTNQYLHTNFKIKESGESLYLFSSQVVLVDFVGAVALTADVSMGRKPDGGSNWLYFSEPTPGISNNTVGSVQLYGDTVKFSISGGIHAGGVVLSLSSSNPEDTIYYTLDGSAPKIGDSIYTSEIIIDTTTVVRARVINFETIPGPVITNTYITEKEHKLPVICLSTEPENFWDYNTGILEMGPNAESNVPYFGANFWQDWERTVHFEMYDTTGNKVIDQGAGVKVFGNWSRANDQKSLALFARAEYGKGSFEYPFFSNRPIDKFESIVLRNSGNDYAGTRFQDGFNTGITHEMNTDRQAFQPAVVYLNGKYWGLLNIREKVNEHFLESNHGVNPDSVNLLELTGDVIVGSNANYTKIKTYLNTNSSLVTDEKFSWIANQLDIDNYIQYQLTQIYLDNTDWPGNNIKYWNTTSPMSRWRWIMFDTDFGFGNIMSSYQNNTLYFALATNGPGWPNPPWSTLLFRRMVTNISFRNNFINQYADRLNVDFEYKIAYKQWDSLAAIIEPEIQNHRNKWGGNFDEWKYLVNEKKKFAFYRPKYSRDHIQTIFDLEGQLNIELNVSNINQGQIFINTVYPKSYPFKGVYFQDIPIRLTAVSFPGYKFDHWEGTVNDTNVSIAYNMASSANITAYFVPATKNDEQIVINEINYNSATNLDANDWLEIVNAGKATVDLSNWLLSDTGPDSGFVFPSGTRLVPNQYLVICTNSSTFASLYPSIKNSIGELPFKLGSKGDHILLYDDTRFLKDEVEYDNVDPWPTDAGGTGMTIELIHPTNNNNLGENWKSETYGGTPGKPNTQYTFDVLDIKPVEVFAAGFECFPNPFNDFTTIQFTIQSQGSYRLEIFDIQGSLVEILADENLQAGTYYYDWFGRTQNGVYLPIGIYQIRLSGENACETIKVIKISK